MKYVADFFGFMNSCGTGGDCDALFFMVMVGAGILSVTMFLLMKLINLFR